MGKRIEIVLWTLVAVLVMGSLGCSLWSSPSGPLSEVGQTQGAQDARVQFRIALPGQPPADAPTPSIRGDVASSTGTTVTFQLTLLNPGNTTNPTSILTKTVSVGNDGSAQTSFANLPVTTIVGEVLISGGNIGGKTDFHGAADLRSGDNVVTLSPKGSGMTPDLVARVVRKVINTPALMAVPLPRLVENVQSANTYYLTATPTPQIEEAMYQNLVNAGVYTFESVGFATAGGDSVTIGQLGTRSAAQILAGTDFASRTLYLESVAQPGLGGVGFVRWMTFVTDANPLCILGKVSSQGVLLGYLAIEGAPWYRGPTEFLRDGTVVMAGNLGNQPVVLRWDGTNRTVRVGQENQFSGTWVQRMGEAGTGTLPRCDVEFLEVDNLGNRVGCLVRDPVTLGVRDFRFAADTGSPLSVSNPAGLGIWATSRPGSIMVGWESLTAAVSYNLYWSEQNTLSKTAYQGKVTGVRSPYFHTGVKENTSYFYRVTWLDKTGVESAESVAARGVATGLATASAATESLTLYATTRCAYIRYDNGDVYVWDPSISTQTVSVFPSTARMGRGFLVDALGNQWQLRGATTATLAPSVRQTGTHVAPEADIRTATYVYGWEPAKIPVFFPTLRFIYPGGNMGTMFLESGDVWNWSFDFMTRNTLTSPRITGTLTGVVTVDGTPGQPYVLFQDGRLQSFDYTFKTPGVPVDLATQGIGKAIDFKAIFRAPFWGQTILDESGQVFLSPGNTSFPVFSPIPELSDIKKLGGAFFLRKDGKVVAHHSKTVFFKAGSVDLASISTGLQPLPQANGVSIAAFTANGGSAWRQGYFENKAGVLSFLNDIGSPGSGPMPIPGLTDVSEFSPFGGHADQRLSLGVFTLHSDGIIRETILARYPTYVLATQTVTSSLLSDAERFLSSELVKMKSGAVYWVTRSSSYQFGDYVESTVASQVSNLTASEIKQIVGSFILKTDGKVGSINNSVWQQLTGLENISQISTQFALTGDGKVWRFPYYTSAFQKIDWTEMTPVANPIAFYNGMIVDASGNTWATKISEVFQTVPGIDGAVDIAGDYMGTNFGMALGSDGMVWGFRQNTSDSYAPTIDGPFQLGKVR